MDVQVHEIVTRVAQAPDLAVGTMSWQAPCKGLTPVLPLFPPPQLYFKVVEPSKELSVEYTLTTPKELPPNDYQVALTVFYEAADGFKSTTFFNETITVTEKKQLVDTGLLWLYMMMVGIVGVAGECSGPARGGAVAGARLGPRMTGAY